MRAMTSERENIALARDLLESVDLWRERYAPVSELSHGQQRQVEIIMALASNPKMILLDEPSAGLTPGESEVLSEIIRALPSETTVFFSAHDLDLVFSLADKVIVLHQGEVIAEKPPAQIQTDPKVREVYLGVKHQEPSGA
jgi:branched-chain amino acid transport system ATP-binding protein